METHQERDNETSAIPEFGHPSEAAGKTKRNSPDGRGESSRAPENRTHDSTRDELILHDDDEAEIELPG